MTRPRPDRYERRLRNVQMWALLGLFVAVMLRRAAQEPAARDSA